MLSNPDPQRPWLEDYEVGLIVEWLRWLGIGLGLQQAEALGVRLRQLVQQARDSQPGNVGGIRPEQADSTAAAVLANLG
jgi:hypothetical protein